MRIAEALAGRTQMSRQGSSSGRFSKLGLVVDQGAGCDVDRY
jgi:hypothetical protein